MQFGGKVSRFVFFYYFCDMKQLISFSDDLSRYSFIDNLGNVVHTLCTSGSMSFMMNHVRYNVSPGDFVIFLNGAIVTDIRQSEDFEAIVLTFSEAFYNADTVRNNYSIVGHLSLLSNPVMPLGKGQMEVCRTSMLVLKDRWRDTSHLFYGELLGALLKAHVLELLDIHSKAHSRFPPESRPAITMSKFITMLENGEYIHSRSLGHYAEKLCITPHYLSDISKKLSGQPATYWIERFTINDIMKRLLAKETTLTEIADTLNFASVSYLSRFIKKQTGYSPTTLLKRPHR